jgi:uncharacterized delta-60 repeat protein
VREPIGFGTRRSIALAATAAAVFVSVTASAAPGDLDLSFGSGGVATTDFGWNERGVGAVLQPDGKLVVAGSAFLTDVDGFMLVRYNADGTLDTSFGSGGKVHTHAVGHVRTRGVALQRDGGIVVIGNGVYDDGSGLLVRYLPNGSVDATFGAAGAVTTDVGLNRAVAIQRNGRIVAAGAFNSDFIVARYMPNGSLDPSFDGDGRVTIGTSIRSEYTEAVAVGKDGKIVLAGASSATGDLCPDVAVAQLTGAGSPDTTFDTDGVALTNLTGEDRADEVAIDATGRIVVAGQTWMCPARNIPSWFVMRYTRNGVQDSTFADSGVALVDFGQGVPAYALGLALQADGRIISAGAALQPGAFAVVRHNSDGSLDTSFSDDGKATAMPNWAEARSVMIQPDGKIVVGGNSNADVAVARFEGGPLCRRDAGVCGIDPLPPPQPQGRKPR